MAELQATLDKAMRVVAAQRDRIDALEAAARAPVAVVGIGCRYPCGITTAEAFWSFAESASCAAGPMPPERPDRDPSRMGAFLGDIDRFDAAYFGLAPREAAAMDPQQRLLLEVSHEALADACLPAALLKGSRTGVFVGAMAVDYERNAQAPGRIDGFTGTGTSLGVLSGRLSHHYDLTGPCETISTSCSSSLVAVHRAVSALRRGECDVALAAGVNVALASAVWDIEIASGMLAEDGRSKAFDAAADGFGRGEGCAVLVLRRLEDAKASADAIHGVILGSATGHDGRAAGLMVPNPRAQTAVIEAALAAAGVSAAELGYVETHGTGTPLGDPIEAAALAALPRDGAPPLTLGASKANFGHTEGAAGVTGLVRLILALKAGRSPRQPWVAGPNPAIPWGPGLRLADGEPLDAHAPLGGVSAFGFSGTNAHVVVAAPPPVEARADPSNPSTLVLSAPDRPRLERLAADWIRWLEARPTRWPEAAEASHRRDVHAAHIVIRAANAATAIDALQRVASGRAPAAYAGGEDAPSPQLSAGGTPTRALHGLPQMAWADTRFWLAAPKPGQAEAREAGALYVHELEPVALEGPPTRRSCVVVGTAQLAARVTEALEAAGAPVAPVTPEGTPAPDASVILCAPPDAEAAVAEAVRWAQRATRENRTLSLVSEASIEGTPRPDAAAAAAFLRCAFIEAPALAGTIVTLDDAAPYALAAALGQTREREVHVRGDRLFAPRLEELPMSAENRDPPAFRADRAYLVTGGFGTVGLALAAWLVARGARHLILFGRTLPDDASWQALLTAPAKARQAAGIADLAARGAALTLAEGDVADTDALADALLRAGVPLGGIVHAAGVSGVGTQNVDAVLHAKVAGTRALAALAAAAPKPLDLFLLTSSAGVWGGRGLGVYAAANAFMDRFAMLRHAAGHRALSIQFGGWRGSSMLDADQARYQASQGFRALAPDRMLRLLDEALAANRPVVAAVDLDPDRYASVLAPSELARVLGRLVKAKPASPADEGVRERVLAAHPTRRESLILAHVEALSASLLGHEGNAPGTSRRPDDPLQALGFNSLVGLELADALARDFGVRLPAGLIYQNPTLRAVCGAVLRALEELPGETAGDPTETAPDDEIAVPDEAIEAAHRTLLGQLGAAP